MRSRKWLMVLASGIASVALAAKPPSKAPETIDFDGEALELAYRDKDATDGIREFIPRGETLENWTKLAAIREQGESSDSAELAAAMVKNLQANYPTSPFKVIENKKTGETIVDFVVWPEDGSFVEFNVFKYTKNPKGGLLSQQYALRAYGDDTVPFLKGLRPLRERLVAGMAKTGLTRNGVAILGAWGVAVDGTDAASTTTSESESAEEWGELESSSDTTAPAAASRQARNR